MTPTNEIPSLSIVVPCYNEEEVLPETILRISAIIQLLIDKNKVSQSSYVFFVDDGSRDRTWEIIESHAQSNDFVKGYKLSRNRGHQNALLAGLHNAQGDILISIDADLQDDTNAIEAMVDEYAKGYEVVYGVRSKRETDTFFKRFTAEAYYKLLAKLGVELVFNHADYRLLSRKALEELKRYSEVNLFLRGIVPQLGFSSTSVEYERHERFAGESKYPLKKMLAFAAEGVTSFSHAPLRFITGLGFVVSLFAFFMIFWVLAVKLFSDNAVPGWASIVIPVFFIGGVQLLSLGVVGEYIAKIYMETKSRPLYTIEKEV